MSKKSKHSKAKFKYTQSTQTRDINRNLEPVKTITVEPKTQAATLAAWQEQYKYIGSELIRICIIAGVFFIILIILSFILH